MSTEIKQTGVNPYYNQTYFDVSSSQTSDTKEKEIKLSRLPNDENSSINWLGSSYSGSDIKVVVHLYNDFNYISKLEKEINSLQGLIGRINVFLGSSLAYISTETILRTYIQNNGRERWVQNTNSGDPQNLAVSEWLNYYPFFIADPNAATTRMNIDVVLFQNNLIAAQERINKLKQISLKATETLVLGTLQTLSVQSFRDKNPVRSLGTSYVKGFVRGARTIAGSMIFTVFNEHALAQLIRAMAGSDTWKEMDADLSSLIADQLPPIDITITFRNEYGSVSSMSIYGVEFTTDGMTLSIEDIITEEVLQFVARDIDVMQSRGSIKLSQYEKGMHYRDMTDTSATNLLYTSQEAYSEYLKKIGIKRRLSNR